MATNNVRSILIGTVAAAISIAVVGCGAGGDADSASTESVDASSAAVDGQINGDLLHSFTAGTDHIVQFYDFGDGKVGVRESLPMEGQALLDRVDQRLPLAEIHRIIQPGVEIPKALIAADARMAQARLSTPVPPSAERETLTTSKDIGATSLAPIASQAPKNVAEGVASQSQAAVVCSADAFGDAWGAQWFLNNYCNWGCSRECQTNWGSAHAKVEGNDRFKWKQMEGDFTNAGKISAYMTGYPYPAPHYFYNYSILPRKVEVWFFDNIGWSWQTIHAIGQSPCGHLHFLKGWCN